MNARTEFLTFIASLCLPRESVLSFQLPVLPFRWSRAPGRGGEDSDTVAWEEKNTGWSLHCRLRWIGQRK